MKMRPGGSGESESGGQGLPNGSFNLLRIVALAAAVAGAVGSVWLMLRVGHRHGAGIPGLLVVLFTGWVASPFAVLMVADLVWKRQAVLVRGTLYWLMLILTLGSLILYGDAAVSPPRPKPASLFLVVPFASWLLMAVVVSAAAFVSRRQPPGGGT